MSYGTGNWLKNIWRSRWFSLVIDVLMVLLFLGTLLTFALLLTVPSLEVGQGFVNTVKDTMSSQPKN
jgi:hypothetical protein